MITLDEKFYFIKKTIRIRYCSDPTSGPVPNSESGSGIVSYYVSGVGFDYVSDVDSSLGLNVRSE